MSQPQSRGMLNLSILKRAQVQIAQVENEPIFLKIFYMENTSRKLR